jgi:hypothetical protein
MRSDTMWRDPSLSPWHAARGIPFPAAGMVLPMVEYDNGAPVGLVSYIHRDWDLPTGGPSYRAMAGLHKVNGDQLPFLTAVYDPFNWAYRMLAHNDAGRKLLGTDGWKLCTERQFVSLLYGMRDRLIPALERYNVRLHDLPWNEDLFGTQISVDEDKQPWPGADLSARRREFEPVHDDGRSVPFRMRIPCADIDLAVSCDAGRMRVIVDYKQTRARINIGNTTHRALGSLYRPGGYQVPYVVARSLPDGVGVEVIGANTAGQALTGAGYQGRGTFDPTKEWKLIGWDEWAGWIGGLMRL